VHLGRLIYYRNRLDQILTRDSAVADEPRVSGKLYWRFS